MNNGRYFFLDKAISDLATGHIIFNYRRVRTQEKPKDNTPEYPIYVAISPHCVYFKTHIATGKLHGHFDLLTIPLDKGMITDSNFTEILRKTYNTDISSSCQTNEIMKFLAKNLDGNLEQKQEAGKESSEDGDKKKYVTYSTLDVFNREGKGSDYYLLRKLILDFLYDLDHTSIFSLSPYSNALLSKLCENYLFNAILRKARFYYYRQLLEEECIRELVVPTFIQKAKDWNNTIRHPHAESLFHDSNWCYDVEKEMLDMFRLNKYTIMQIIFRFIQFIFPFIKPVCNKLLVRCRLKQFQSQQTDAIKKDPTWQTLHLLSINWFLKRYSFSKALLLLFFPGLTEPKEWFNYPGLICMLAITLIFLFYPVSTLVVLFFLGIPYLLIGFFKKNAALLVILPRLAVLILSAWIVTTFNGDLLRCFFDVKFNLPFVLICIVIPLLTVILFITESRKINLTASWLSRFYNSCYIILLGLFYSVTFGLILSSMTCRRILNEADFLKKFYTREVYQTGNVKIEPCYSFLANTFLKECIGREDLPAYVNDCQHIITGAGGWLKRFEPYISQLPDISFNSPYIAENEFFQCKGNRQKLLYILCLDLLEGKERRKENAKSVYYTLYSTPPVAIAYADVYKQLFKFPLSADSYFEGLQYLVWQKKDHERKVLEERYLPLIGKTLGIKTRYFPGFLVLFTFISIFLSIFLQVIIDDKKVTHTL